jgi:hypothetical protein
VTQYCFGQSDHRIEADGFDPTFHNTSFAAGTANTMMRHMNWIMKITKALPESWAMKASAEFSSFVTLMRVRNPHLCKRKHAEPSLGTSKSNRRDQTRDDGQEDDRSGRDDRLPQPPQQRSPKQREVIRPSRRRSRSPRRSRNAHDFVGFKRCSLPFVIPAQHIAKIKSRARSRDP